MHVRKSKTDRRLHNVRDVKSRAGRKMQTLPKQSIAVAFATFSISYLMILSKADSLTGGPTSTQVWKVHFTA